MAHLVGSNNNSALTPARGAVGAAAILKVSQVFRNSGAELGARMPPSACKCERGDKCVCVACVACGAAMPPLCRDGSERRGAASTSHAHRTAEKEELLRSASGSGFQVRAASSRTRTRVRIRARILAGVGALSQVRASVLVPRCTGMGAISEFSQLEIGFELDSKPDLSELVCSLPVYLPACLLFCDCICICIRSPPHVSVSWPDCDSNIPAQPLHSVRRLPESLFGS